MPFAINADLVWVDNNDEVRLYDPGKGQFQTLNASASQIWRLLADHADVNAVSAELASRFGGDDEQEQDTIRREVRAFVDSLIAQELLVETQ